MSNLLITFKLFRSNNIYFIFFKNWTFGTAWMISLDSNTWQCLFQTLITFRLPQWVPFSCYLFSIPLLGVWQKASLASSFCPSFLQLGLGPLLSSSGPVWTNSSDLFLHGPGPQLEPDDAIWTLIRGVDRSRRRPRAHVLPRLFPSWAHQGRAWLDPRWPVASQTSVATTQLPSPRY